VLEHGMVVQSVILLLGGRTWTGVAVCNPAIGVLEHGMVVQIVILLLGGKTWADAAVCNPATGR
jgi:hypothetical protein